MGLKGSLDELSILDVLQIVAFSNKTGILKVTGSFGQGAVLFKNGLVFSAYSPSTLEFLRQNKAKPPSEEQQAFLTQQVQMALRELTELPEGDFEFELTKDLPDEHDGVALLGLYLREGIDTQSLLLGVAKEIDEERRQATELIESSFQADSIPEAADFEAPRDEAPSPELPTVVLVDDEPLVTGIVGAELQSRGYQVQTASNPDEGVSAVRSLVDSGRQVLVVTDLRMPTTTGKSFFGGFELVQMLKRNRLGVPVLLVTEKLPSKIRAQARRLGVRRVVFKPALSKLDPEQYGADLRSFSTVLIRQLERLAEIRANSGHQKAPSENGDGKSSFFLDFLTSMTGHLVHPRDSGEVTRMLLHVASRYLERGILFLLKQSRARGLGGFGLGDTHKANFEVAQKLLVDLHEVEAFSEVVHGRNSCRIEGSVEAFQKSLYGEVGRGRSQECILIPLLNNNEVIAILYGDNAETGRPLGKLRGLELFFKQAGMALENLSLRRKLRFFESMISEGRPLIRGV